MNAEPPPVYKAVRAVGFVTPKFQPGSRGGLFAEKLDVRGTAFWLKDYKALVTCAHVVQNLLGAPVEVAGLLVVGNLGNYTRATISLLDFAHDLAILQLPPDVPANLLEQEAATGLELVDTYPQVASAVGYAGFPLGLQLLNSTHAPTYAEGVVGAQLRRHSLRKDIQVTGAVVGGFSGAPVVLKEEPTRIVGVLSNSPSQDAGNANIFMAISWEHVKALAELSKS